MLRLTDRGVPPHMLHLYQTNAGNPAPKTEFHDDAPQFPAVLLRLSAHVLTRLASLRSRQKTDNFVPFSAKTPSHDSFEQQYHGETALRDTRWKSS